MHQRDLLFGVLAVQLNFVTVETLASHLSGKGELGDRLVLAGALNEARRKVIDSAVAEHLAAHADDLEGTLASIPVTRQLRESLAESADEMTLGSISLLAIVRDRPTPPPSTPEATSVVDGSDLRGRYQLLRHHADGGLGQVSVALDTELNREVALKEVLPKYAQATDAAERFLREAEITGNLEHPGIVPVYGLGRESGKPFYAMRFIRGESMADAIREFHNSSASTGADRVLVFRELLSRFTDVCDAVHYAHSRGVIHRDLKPSNVMLGKYGETLVVDWGLAKSLGTSDPEITEPPVVESGEGNSATVAGTAIGTPVYMSPEQAEGRLDLLGPATDVYALGGILCTLLTGKSPVIAVNRADVLSKVRRGEIRTAGPCPDGVRRPLWAVCQKAMALQIDGRYANARELSAEVERFLADEPVTAYAEPLVVRTRRWLRRHPAATAGLAASLVLGLLAATVIAIVVSGYSKRLSDTNEQLVISNQAEAAARTTAEANEQKAIAERVRADAVRDYLVSAFRSTDAELDGRDVTVASVLDRAAKEVPVELADQPILQADLLAAIGNSYLSLGLRHDAAMPLERAFQLMEQHLGADDPRTLDTGFELGFAWFWTQRFKDAAELGERIWKARVQRLGEDDPATMQSRNLQALSLCEAGLWDESIAIYEDLVPRQTRILGPEHDNTLESRNNQALSYVSAGRYEEAIAIFQEQIPIQERIQGPKHPDTILNRHNLGWSYLHANRLKEAVAELEPVISLRAEVLGPSHEATLRSQNALGTAYMQLARFDDAITMFERSAQAIRIDQGPKHANTLQVLHSYGEALAVAGRYDESCEVYEQLVIDREEVLGDSHIETLKSQQNLAFVYNKLGRVEDAAAIFEKLLPLFRESVGVDSYLTVVVSKNLATAFTETGRAAEAVAILRKTLEEAAPKLGDDNINIAKAAAQLTESLKVADKLEATDDVFIRWGPVMESQVNTWLFAPRFLMLQGEAQRAAADHVAALTTLTTAYDAFEAIVERIPESDRHWLPETAEAIAEIHAATGDAEKAAEWKEKATADRNSLGLNSISDCDEEYVRWSGYR